MNRFPRKSMLGAFALAATLAAPQAFAQDMGADPAPPTETTSGAHGVEGHPTPETQAGTATDTMTGADASAQSATDASTQSTTDTATQSTAGTAGTVTDTQTASEYKGDAGEAAATGAQSGQMSWTQVDTDGDGNLSRAEAGAIPALGELFDQADANGDESLSADEYRSYAESQGATEAGGQ